MRVDRKRQTEGAGATIRAVKRILSWLAVAAITLVLLEAVLRLATFLPQAAPDYVADPDVGYRAKPSIRHGAVVTNAQGFNDGMADAAAGSDMPYLAFVGDSFTFGSYPYPQVFPHLTGERLAAEGIRSRVRNLGIPGASPWQYAAVIRHDLVRAGQNPDVIIVTVYVGNDIVQANAAFSTRLWFGTVRMLPKPFAIGLSLEYLYAFKMGRAAVRTIGDLLGKGGVMADPFLRNEYYALPTYARDPARYVRQGYDGMEAALTAIAAAANSAGASLMVVLAPARIQIDPSFRRRMLTTFDLDEAAYDFARPQTQLVAFMTEAEIPFLDLRDVLSAAPAADYRAGDIHWSEQGNRVVADAIAAALAPRLAALMR